MAALADLDTIAHAIQLAVAPVFLLAGVGAILNVMTARLSRAVDRSRTLCERQRQSQPEDDTLIRQELAVLDRRIIIINLAIALCVLCALLVCTVVAVIFLALVIDIELATPIVWAFVSAMTFLIIALLCLLREIYLATMKRPIRR
jgi:hypothetical protein